jgi:hypothetical protein
VIARALLLVLAVAAGEPGAARPPARGGAFPACDGVPPELHNQDAVARAYTLTCGSKVTDRSVAPAEKQVLEGFSGCTLALGGLTAILHTEMVCTVQAGGKLACDLL